MALPLPTVPNIDVTAERLKDVDRSYEMAPKKTGLAEGVLAGVQTGEAMNQTIENMDKRERANTMQKILDAGWPAYEEAWKAAGSKPGLSPDLLKGVPDGLILGWKGVSEENQSAAANKAVEAYNAVLADPNATEQERTAARIRAGVASGKGFETVENVEKEGAAVKKEQAKQSAISSRAAAHEEFTREMKNLDRAVAWARVNKSRLKPGFYKQLQADRDALADLIAAETAYDPTAPASILDPGKINDIRVRKRDIMRRIAAAGYKDDGEGGDTETPPPPPADTGLTASSSDSDIAAALKAAGKDSSPASIAIVRKNLGGKK